MHQTLPKPDYAAALEWGRVFVFERRSVVRLHEFLAAASRRLLGTDASMDRLTEESKKAGIVTAEDGERITSVDGLQREWAIVEHARRQRGQYRPFTANFDLSATSLDGGQQRAVSHLLQSRDGVTLFRGAAGTGKTFALRELVGQLESAGHAVRIAAPQGQQARTLTADGMPAVTLARLLNGGDLPLRGVVIVDEAGQIGGRQMEALFNLAQRHAARLILSGDTRQHPSVEASDAMRSLEAFSRVRIAEIKTIRRQDPRLGQTAEERAQIAVYRRAVEDASAGQVETALAQLVTVESVAAGSLTVVAGGGQRRRVALKYSDRWEILERHEITAGIGSLLQLRANGLSREGRKFCNGEHVTIRTFHEDGSIGVVDRDGADLCLWPDQRILQPGYAVNVKRPIMLS